VRHCEERGDNRIRPDARFRNFRFPTHGHCDSWYIPRLEMAAVSQ